MMGFSNSNFKVGETKTYTKKSESVVHFLKIYSSWNWTGRWESPTIDLLQ